MSALANTNTKILVTGANGYIASWIVASLLKRGYIVHASVRSEDRGTKLLETFKSYVDDGKLKLVVVRDMQEDGAWDEAVKDVDGVVHTAAEVHLSAVEPGDIIEPNVKSVIGLLESALRYGSSIKRIVYTSSCATIVDSVPSTVISVSEDDWNEADVKRCEQLGKDASGLAKYSASKVLAERALWDWHEKHKNSTVTPCTWDISVLNPPWVLGPSAHQITTYSELGGSNKALYHALTQGQFFGLSPGTTATSLNSPSVGWVDVRDFAEAHILALEVPKAGGERIIVCAGSGKAFVWQDFLDVAQSLNPPPYPSIAKGSTGEAFRAVTYASTKAKDILGLKYRTMEELTRDTLEECARLDI
ncbi:hypothetical protein VNI00_006268 [Paramarasmius palmivorus]|uniref:NAD-dependent epimerase/dehydratase domain-containing protein n=1 Tax=Paramarasmius palmivorus TaxID=297713 RepID=A0AAW0D7V8_9AGAR